MNREQSVFDILARWEDAARAGHSISIESLCHNQPELLAEVRQKIEILKAVDRQFGSVEDRSRPSVPRATHETSNDEGGDTDPDGLELTKSDSSWHDAKIALGSQFSVRDVSARGGLGEIFHAYDETLGRTVALKVMRAPLESNPQRRQRFMREAIITGQLEHPGIAPVYAVGQDAAGRLCYAMRFLEGETLRQAAQKLQQLRLEGRTQEAALELRRLLARFISVCNTVAYAHSHQIVHRDIKPPNIMFGSFGETFVLDWGLAKQLRSDAHAPQPTNNDQAADVCQQDESTTGGATDMNGAAAKKSAADDEALTSEDMIVGTPVYMSPEQTYSLAHVGIASDIYSLGATLFFILTGSPPVREEQWVKLIERVRRGQIDRPRTQAPEISPALEAICLKALALTPSDRYRTALDLADDLEKFLADHAVSAFQENLWQRLARLGRRHRVLTQSAAGFLVALSAVTSVFAIAMNYQRTLAVDARNAAERLAEQTQQLAEQEAIAKATAQKQSALALETLRSVILDIQRKLRNVSGGVEARRSMLQTAIDGLAKVSASIKQQSQVDRNLMIALNDIGSIYLTVGQSTGEDATRQALECFRQSLQIAQELATQDDTVDAQRDISVAYEKLGEAYWQHGQVDEAENAYRKSFEISQRLNENGKFDRDLAFGYEKIGDICLEKGQKREALTAYEQSRDYFQTELNRHPDNLNLKRDMIVSLSKLGNAHLQLGAREAASQAYSQCIAQQRELVSLPDSPVSKRDLSVMLNKLGTVQQEDKQYGPAEASFGQSLHLAREYLADEPENLQRRRDVTISLNNLGGLHLASGQFEKAKEYFAQSLDIRKQTAEINPDSPAAQVDYAYTLERLADVETQSGNPQSAATHLTTAQNILKPLADKQLLQTAFSQELYATIVKELAKHKP